MKKKNKIITGISVALTMAAIVFVFLKRKKDAGEVPPKKAPQLRIDNPGEQSEFTTSASESEIG
jgi:hypothetical protein